MKTTKTTAHDVMDNLYALLDSDDELWASFADMLTAHAETSAGFRKALDAWLDEMLAEDAFGTEGQNDPRGDHREEG